MTGFTCPSLGTAQWDSLNLHVHVHSLLLDGVYFLPAPDAALSFVPLPAPADVEVAQLAETVARRIEALLQRRNMRSAADGNSNRGQESGVTDVAATGTLSA